MNTGTHSFCEQSCIASNKATGGLGERRSNVEAVAVRRLRIDNDWRRSYRLDFGRRFPSTRSRQRQDCNGKPFTSGNGLATASGDGTVKLWNFEEKKCVKTFIENQAIWAVKFHETGQMMATASLDHIARLWDLASEKCKSVFRFVRIVSALCMGTT